MGKKTIDKLECLIVKDFTYNKKDFPGVFKNENIEEVVQFTCARGFVSGGILRVNGCLTCDNFVDGYCEATKKFGVDCPTNDLSYSIHKAMVLSEKREIEIKKQLIDSTPYTDQCINVVNKIIKPKISLFGALSQYINSICLHNNYEEDIVLNYISFEVPFITYAWLIMNEKEVPDDLREFVGVVDVKGKAIQEDKIDFIEDDDEVDLDLLLELKKKKKSKKKQSKKDENEDYIKVLEGLISKKGEKKEIKEIKYQHGEPEIPDLSSLMAPDFDMDMDDEQDSTLVIEEDVEITVFSVEKVTEDKDNLFGDLMPKDEDFIVEIGEV